MPIPKPGASRQDWGSPPEFLNAVRARFGPITWDLAAHDGNAVVPDYLGPNSPVWNDSLGFDWGKLPASDGEVLWLNPPFKSIASWAAKAAAYTGPATVCMLVPASVGANWYWDSVERWASVYALSPRLTFVGAGHVYPKDLILAAYGHAPDFNRWKWK